MFTLNITMLDILSIITIIIGIMVGIGIIIGCSQGRSSNYGGFYLDNHKDGSCDCTDCSSDSSDGCDF